MVNLALECKKLRDQLFEALSAKNEVVTRTYLALCCSFLGRFNFSEFTKSNTQLKKSADAFLGVYKKELNEELHGSYQLNETALIGIGVLDDILQRYNEKYANILHDVANVQTQALRIAFADPADQKKFISRVDTLVRLDLRAYSDSLRTTAYLFDQSFESEYGQHSAATQERTNSLLVHAISFVRILFKETEAILNELKK